MAKKLYEESSVQDIAAAIRARTGSTETYKIGEMAAAVQAISGSETVEWHQCPEAVRNYLANVAYDPADYSTSRIADYAPGTAVTSNYKPIGKTIGNKTFYNECPNVATPFAVGRKAGTLKPLDKLRWIQTNALNVRDLGGWDCDGGTVRYGLLIRGGEPSAADYSVLVQELGVRYDLNLRGSSEATWTKSPLGDDVYFVKADAYNWYTLTNTEVWRINLRCVFDAVTHGLPVYFHCAAGADRTATLACVLEGLLGMSQSDIDKDYELTSFYSGTDTTSNTRSRNKAEWQGLIAAINAKSGSTFRDKCVTFAAELGFTAAEINAYRKAMIDGAPETVTPSISTFTITNILNGAVTDNAAAKATQYQPYEAAINAEYGKIINFVKVTMGGVDITANVYQGNETELYHKVTLNLVHCSADNLLPRVIDGQSYGANITPNEGYTLDGATASVMMGGTDMSNYYSGGKIAVPCVTGDITVTITAVESAPPPATNIIDTIGISADTRLSTSSGVNKTQDGCATIGANMDAASLIHLKARDTLRIKGMSIPPTSDTSTDCAIVLYNADAAFVTSTYLHDGLMWNNITITNSDGIVTIVSSVERYIRVTMKCTDASAVIATLNEPIN